VLVCSTWYWLTADPGMNLRSIWSENGGAYGGPSDAYLFLRPTLAIIHTSAMCVHIHIQYFLLTSCWIVFNCEVLVFFLKVFACIFNVYAFSYEYKIKQNPFNVMSALDQMHILNSTIVNRILKGDNLTRLEISQARLKKQSDGCRKTRSPTLQVL